MTWTPGTVTANFNPVDVAQRCPDGWAERGGAIVTATGGAGELTYQGRTVRVTVNQSHCSLPRPHARTMADLFARTVTPIDIESGRMAIISPSGDLALIYRAPGVFKGDLTFVGYNVHTSTGLTRSPAALDSSPVLLETATSKGSLKVDKARRSQVEKAH